MMRSSNSMSCSRSASHARIAQLDAFLVPEYRIFVITYLPNRQLTRAPRRFQQSIRQRPLRVSSGPVRSF
jgi:hypothetical protein